MLNMTVDKLDGLDESIQSLYVKSEDGYTLNVEGLEDVSGLKSALIATRTEIKGYKAEIAGYKTKADDAETLALTEQGKYKELFEAKNTENLQSQKDFKDLTAQIAQGNGKVLVKDLALSMTTDQDEIEIISRFAEDALTFEGKEAKFKKTVEELKTELSRFVRSKANGSGDTGNNDRGGKETPKSFKEKQKEIFK